MRLGGVCSLMWVSLALADNCDSINTNSEWKAQFDQLNEAYAKEDWGAALKHSRGLEEICDQSPVLNYTIAQIHKNRGDQEKYLFYLTKATQNTERFSLDKNALDKIWSEKYLAAHPDAAPESIAARNAEIEELKGALAAASSSQIALEHASESKALFWEDQAGGYKALMWTGIGSAVAGAALIAAGAVLVMKPEPIIEVEVEKNGLFSRSENAVNPVYKAGWGLLGAGAALAVAGAVVGGISGYKYKLAKDNLTLSLNYSLGSAWMTIDF